MPPRTIIPGDAGRALPPRGEPADPPPAQCDGKSIARRGLTPAQVTKLAILSKRAYEQEKALGLLADGVTFDAWRHAECQAAAGVPGLTGANQATYRTLRAHFAKIAGDDADAFRDHIGAGSDAAQGTDLATHHLKKNCEKFDLAYPAYPAAICRSQFKCSLGDATAKQLWKLIYTIRTRGRAKKN